VKAAMSESEGNESDVNPVALSKQDRRRRWRERQELTVEGYDEENDELWEEERVDLDGETYIVIDDGVEMLTTGPVDE
jgi:hypothetical protein